MEKSLIGVVSGKMSTATKLLCLIIACMIVSLVIDTPDWLTYLVVLLCVLVLLGLLDMNGELTLLKEDRQSQ